jgi:hypothetical protein
VATRAGEEPRTGVADSAPGRVAYHVGRLLGRGLAFVERVPPWLVLGSLLLLSWGIAAEVGRIALHNGPLYHNAGDGTWYYTTSWSLGHGTMPLSVIGYGYPLLIAPIAAAAGANMLAALPAIIAFNLLVLAPVALLCVYGIVRMLAGRAYSYLACLVWVLFPVAVIHYFLSDFHTRYVDIALPSEVGLTMLGDFSSMVVLLVAAYFTLRLASSGRRADALAAGFAVGLALVIKPANALFVPAPVLALLVARRFTGLALGAAATLPSLIGLLLWKQRGLGNLPLFQGAGYNRAGVAALALTLVGSSHLDLSRYVTFDLHQDWHQLHHNLDSFREYTWSQRMVYFTVGGGLVGLARRSTVTVVLAGTWLLAYFVVKGVKFDITNGSFFTHFIAPFPAYFLLVVSVPFLLPFVGRRGAASRSTPSAGRLPVVAAGVLGLVSVAGMLFVAVVPTSTASSMADLPNPNLFVPLNQFPVTATTGKHGVTLSWPKQNDHGATIGYSILRSPDTGAPDCVRTPSTSATCVYFPNFVGVTKRAETSFVDHPKPGAWVYRVAVTATPYGPRSATDIVVISRPGRVVVHQQAATH